jgi:pyrroloquinoline-quinone synthase
MNFADRAKPARDVADRIIGQNNLLDNVYLRNLKDGRMSKDDFIASQQQFYFAVAEYSKPIAILTSRVDDLRFRFELLRNLLDEHGEFNEKACHESTFRQFVARLGGSDPKYLEMSPAVFSFNSALVSASLYSPVEESISCLAIIEYSFAFISSAIASGIIKRGWLSPDEMTHYSLHANLDLKHADALFALVSSAFDDEHKSKSVERGLELGSFIFKRLYVDLYETCHASASRIACA